MRIEKTDEYSARLDALRDRAGRARILVRVDRFIRTAIRLAKNFKE
jgi:putative component of toxin-antitoxin plasmid stabilization module